MMLLGLFTLQKGGKVPSDVCIKVNAFLNNYKTP